MRDLMVSLFRSIDLAVIKTTVNGTSFDTAPYEAAAVFYITGAYTDGTHTPKVQESADGITWNDVDPSLLTGGGFTAVSSVAGATAVQRTVYIGIKRYIRGVITASGTTGCVQGIYVVAGKGRRVPQVAGA